jgi:hypothetical protein
MLTQIEKEIGRKLIQYNGGTAEEMVRFSALTDEAAKVEISDFKTNQLIAINNELNFYQTKLTELNTQKALLESLT